MAVGAVLAVIFGLKQIAQEGPGPLAIGAIVVGLVVGRALGTPPAAARRPDDRPGAVPRADVQRGARRQLPGDLRGRRLLPVHRPVPAARRRPDAVPGGPAVAALGDRVHRRLAGGAPDRPARQAGVPHQRWAGLRLVGPLPADPGRDDERATAPRRGLGRDLARSGPGVRADDRADRRLRAARTCRVPRRGSARRVPSSAAPSGSRSSAASASALYRGGLPPTLLSGLPPDAATAARDTLGGAVGVASTLPAGTADTLLAVARAAFVDGMHVAAAIAGVIGLGLAAFAYITLRERGHRAIRDRSGLCRADDDRPTRADPGGQAGARMLLTEPLVPILDS